VLMKRILIIGGTLFTGRVFSILASRTGEFELHVVNRGRFPLGELDNVTEYKCDRHSRRMFERIVPQLEFDAVIDFCAYNEGEVAPIVEAFSSRVRQYVLFSTASVYDPTNRKIKEESDPIISGDMPGGAEWDYVAGKIALERELIRAAKKTGMAYTILRPTFIYGPFNYAPREPWYIELIARKHVVPVPIDATAHFNFVYVKDVARALMTLAGDERAYNEVFNLAGPEVVNYMRLMSDFERYNGGSFEMREVTVAEAHEENIPFPFPLTESDITSGEKFARVFDFKYTPFSEGMENTFRTFYSLYTS
ncbi:MAG: NAD-dependent epimerase/dehydratase family protein, partial [Clostridiales bacterium]|nr:NAD-dependent epimerase/dehydratase family protein [Clostridiales bacterium]